MKSWFQMRSNNEAKKRSKDCPENKTKYQYKYKRRYKGEFQVSSQINQKKTMRQKRDQKIASLLILIVTVFAICNSARFIHILIKLFLFLSHRHPQFQELTQIIWFTGSSWACMKWLLWHFMATTSPGQFGNLSSWHLFLFEQFEPFS